MSKQVNVNIRYLTEDLIKSVSKENKFDRIQVLKINSGKKAKPIKYIQNLNKLTHIQILNLNNNLILNIENLDRLHTLRELHLCNNKIKQLDGVKNLIHLRVLNVCENEINTIPSWFGQRCRYITTLGISKNRIDSMDEISKLSSLKELTNINLSNNPINEMDYYRIIVIVKLKHLLFLDEKAVSISERSESINQYERRNIEAMSSKLYETEERLDCLLKQQEAYEKDRAKYQLLKKELLTKNKESNNRIEQLEKDLNMKDQLLKKKSDDLLKTCNKYYELEQDLAFLKIDSKFDLLEEELMLLKDSQNTSIRSVKDENCTGDEAYFGKGQFTTSMKKEIQKRIHGTNNNLSVTKFPPNFTKIDKEMVRKLETQQLMDNLKETKQQNIELLKFLENKKTVNKNISYLNDTERPQSALEIHKPSSPTYLERNLSFNESYLCSNNRYMSPFTKRKGNYYDTQVNIEEQDKDIINDDKIQRCQTTCTDNLNDEKCNSTKLMSNISDFDKNNLEENNGIRERQQQINQSDFQKKPLKGDHQMFEQSEQKIVYFKDLINKKDNELQNLRRQLNMLNSIRRKYDVSIRDNVESLRQELHSLKNDAMLAKEDLEIELEREKALNDVLNQEVTRLNKENLQLNEKLKSVPTDKKMEELSSNLRHSNSSSESKHNKQKVTSPVTKLEPVLNDSSLFQNSRLQLRNIISKIFKEKDKSKVGVMRAQNKRPLNVKYGRKVKHCKQFNKIKGISSGTKNEIADEANQKTIHFNKNRLMEGDYSTDDQFTNKQQRNSRIRPSSVDAVRRHQHIENNSSDESALLETMQDELINLKTYIKENLLPNGSKGKGVTKSADNLDDSLKRRQSNKKYLKQDMLKEIEQCRMDIERLYEQLETQSDSKDNLGSDRSNLQSIVHSQMREIERLNAIIDRITGTQSKPSHSQSVAQSIAEPKLNQNQNFSYSTPVLNNITENPDTSRFSGLFCNIPEHHYLEDYVNKIHKSNSKQKMKLRTGKFKDTMNALQEDINSKSEELDNVEIHMSKQIREVERLSCQIDDLQLTKRDLVHEIQQLKYEISQSKEINSISNSSMGQLSSKKNILNEENNKLQMIIENKTDELARLENSLTAARNNMVNLEAQTDEVIRRYDDSKLMYTKLLRESDELEKRSKDMTFELAKAMNDLKDAQNEISALTSNKINLEEFVSKIQDLVDKKDKDFKKLSSEICRAKNNLSDIEFELSATSEKNREKVQLLVDEDRILSDAKLDFTRLSKEIIEKKEQLELLEMEIGEKSTLIQLNNESITKLKTTHQKMLQDYENEERNLKKKWNELKIDIGELNETKRQSSLELENTKIKMNGCKETLDELRKEITEYQTESDKLSWKIKHSENILNMKQNEIDKLDLNYQESLREFENIQKDILYQKDESKKLDSDIKSKEHEINCLRSSISTETEGLQKLKLNHGDIHSAIKILEKEKSSIKSHLKDIEESTKIFKKQESQLREAVVNLESQLSSGRLELEKIMSEKKNELIQKDLLTRENNNCSKQLHEAKCELQSMKERINVLETQYDEKSNELRKKSQQLNNLNTEIRKLQDQIRLINMNCDELESKENQKKQQLLSLDSSVSQKSEEIKSLESKIEIIHQQVEVKKKEKIDQNSYKEKSKHREIGEENSEEKNLERKNVIKNAAVKEFMEQKILELEETIQNNEEIIHRYGVENKRLTKQVTLLTEEITSLSESHQLDLEDHGKELSRLKKRLSKEISQLEQLAEYQCRRANTLADDLNQARRDYLLLRNRCLAQEHFLDHRSVFEDFLHPIPPPPFPASHFTQSNKPDFSFTDNKLENNSNAEMRFENNRDLSGNVAATVVDNNVKLINGKFNTAKSHTWCHHTENDDADNHRRQSDLKNFENNWRVINEQLIAEFDKLQSDQSRCADMCNQLKSEVNNLKKGESGEHKSKLLPDFPNN